LPTYFEAFAETFKAAHSPTLPPTYFYAHFSTFKMSDESALGTTFENSHLSTHINAIEATILPAKCQSITSAVGTADKVAIGSAN